MQRGTHFVNQLLIAITVDIKSGDIDANLWQLNVVG
jgi:hypothetical protein